MVKQLHRSHNLKVLGSNPSPAPKEFVYDELSPVSRFGGFVDYCDCADSQKAMFPLAENPHRAGFLSAFVQCDLAYEVLCLSCPL